MKKQPKPKSNTKSKKSILGTVNTTRSSLSTSSSLSNFKKQTLIQGSQHLEGIVRSAMDGIVVINEDHEITLFNGAAEKMFGLPESEVLGQSINRLIPERFRSQHEAHVDKFGDTNSTSRSMGTLGEVFGIRHNGEEFPLEATISQSVVEGEQVFAVILRDITERKRTELKLMNLHHEHQLILNTAAEGICGLDREGKTTFVNRTAAEMIGYQPDELIGKSQHAMIHHSKVDGSPYPQEHCPIYAAYKNGRVYHLDTEVFWKKDGTKFPVEYTSTPIFDDHHAAVGAVVTFRDISLRKQAEELERRLGGILDESRNEIFVFDEQTLKFIQISRGARANLGYSLEELRDMTPLDIKPEMTAESLAEILQPLLTNEKEKVHFQTIHGRKDRSQYPVDVHLQRSTWGERKVFLAVILDLTEQQRVQQTLKDERDFSKAVLDTTGALVVVLNLKGQIVSFNRACEETTGYTADEVQGKYMWGFLLVPKEADSVKAIFERLREKGISSQFENDWVAKDESHRRITWSNTVLLDPQGRIKNIIATGIEITEFRRMQEELRQTARLAELGTLASGMAHEIGTPMNVILGRAEHLLTKTDEERTRKGLETIVSQVERITKIMNQLLAFARRKKGEYQPIDLQKIIEESLEVLLERCDRHGVSVRPVFLESGFRIIGDPDHMTQVFLNLFINAIYAMPEGGILQIAIKQENENGAVTISDTGCGISPENISKIFLPFFTTKEIGKGTGLGLSVVKDIVQEHGGVIAVVSEPGKGTTFTITLPRCPQ